MKAVEKTFLALCIGLFALGAAGCRQEGPFERGGEKLDQATERVEDAAEDAGDRARRD